MKHRYWIFKCDRETVSCMMILPDKYDYIPVEAKEAFDKYERKNALLKLAEAMFERGWITEETLEVMDYGQAIEESE